MKECPYCRKKIPENQIECPECGRLIAYCSQCSSPLKEDQKQCNVCGYVRDDSELVSRCKVCGSMIPFGGDQLCVNCRRSYMKCKKCGKIQPKDSSGLCKECKPADPPVISEPVKNKPKKPSSATASKQSTKQSSPVNSRTIAIVVVAALATGIIAFFLGVNLKPALDHLLVGDDSGTNLSSHQNSDSGGGNTDSAPSEETTPADGGETTLAEDNASRYLVVQKPCSWSEAYMTCQNLSDSSSGKVHLAIINTLDEFYEVCDYINAFNEGKNEDESLYYVWVGAHISPAEDWDSSSQWSDGTTMELLWDENLWWPGQPSDTDMMNGELLDEDCLQLWAAKFPDGTDHGWTFNDSCDQLNQMEKYVNPKRIGYVIEFEK